MQTDRTFGRRGIPKPKLGPERRRERPQWTEPVASRLAGAVLTACGLVFVAIVAFGTVRGTIQRMEESSTETMEVNEVAVAQAAEEPTPTIVRDVQTPKFEECGATMAEFQRLRSGMGYRDAVRTIGCEGTEISRVEIGGTTVMYMWEGTDTIIGNMNAMFDNDRLMSKAQMGLR